MYCEASKRAINKYVDKNRAQHNEYQKNKQKEYYKTNPNIKLRKQKEMKWRQITIIFRNILV